MRVCADGVRNWTAAEGDKGVFKFAIVILGRPAADVRQTRGRRVEDAIKTVADVEDAGK